MDITRTATLIISIDFGTSRSGYCWGTYPNKNNQMFVNVNWDNAPAPYCKTLTQLLYKKKNKKLESWGYSCLNQLSEEDTPSDFVLLKYFKMELYNSRDGKFTLGGVEFQVIDVISDYLKMLFEKIKGDLKKVLGKNITTKDIMKWCVTIPAIWQDEQKDRMKKACVKAGLIESENVSEDRFIFILEPEAAACNCLDHLKIQKSIEDGKTFLVVDAGGGTIDITSHIIKKGKLDAFLVGTGNDLGSSKLDDKFYEYLGNLLGDKSKITNLIKNEPLSALEIYKKWEVFKVNLKTLNQDQFFELPRKIFKIFQKEDKLKLIDEDGCLKLKKEDLKDIFSDVLNGITNLVEKQIKEANEKGNDFDYIFVVGGFGSSPILQGEIKKKFEKTKRMVISVPSPSEAIIRGAFLLGVDSSLIRTRKMRVSYGIKAFVQYEEKRHGKCETKVIDGKTCAVNVFDKYVETGQEVEIDEIVEKQYKVNFAKQTEMKLSIYCSKKKDPIFCKSEGVNYLGVLKVKMPDTTKGMERKVKVQWYFGRTEVKVVASDVQSGKNFETNISITDNSLKGEEEEEEEISEKYHIIFGNDTSGSMRSSDTKPTEKFIIEKCNNRFGALYEACYTFLKARSGSSDIVSCFIHEGTSKTIFEKQKMDQNLIHQMLKYNTYTMGGDNSFINAMLEIRKILKTNPEGYTPVVLFMTDGSWDDDGCCDELKKIVNEYPDLTLHSICLGNSISEGLMKSLATIGKGSFSKSGTSLISLKSAYVSLAGLLDK